MRSHLCPCQVPKRLLSQALRFSLRVSEVWRFIHFPSWGPFRPSVLTSQTAGWVSSCSRKNLGIRVRRLLCPWGKSVWWSFHREFLPGISWDIYVFPDPESEKNYLRNHENGGKHNSPATMIVNIDTFLVQQNPLTARVGALTHSVSRATRSTCAGNMVASDQSPRSRCQVTNVGAPSLLPRASFLQIKYMLVCFCT